MTDNTNDNNTPRIIRELYLTAAIRFRAATNSATHHAILPSEYREDDRGLHLIDPRFRRSIFVPWTSIVAITYDDDAAAPRASSKNIHTANVGAMNRALSKQSK